MLRRCNCNLVFGSLVLLAAVLCGVSGDPETNFRYVDCGSSDEVVSVTILPCMPTEQAENGCKLHRGESHMVNVTFLPSVSSIAASHKIEGRVFGMWMPLPGLRRSLNVCSRILGGCPLTPNAPTHYNFPIPIQRFYPEMSVLIRYSILERPTNRVLVCFLLDAEIVQQ